MNNNLHNLLKTQPINKIAKANLNTINSYINKIEQVADYSDPVVSRVVRSLRTIPINTIFRYLMDLEIYLSGLNKNEKTNKKG